MTEMSIGQLIKFRRKGCFLSQKALAKKADVDKKTISFIEKGRTEKPHKTTVELIFAVLEEEEKRIKKMKEEVGLI